MYCLVCAVLSLYLILLAAEGREPSKVTDYCIIGAGPSGMSSDVWLLAVCTVL